MADKTIGWLHAVRAQDQAKPWFVYFSTGCAHAPHHVPEEWAAKYKGKFDSGWDAYREQDVRAGRGWASSRPTPS
jgi:arylsulfatase